MNVTRAAILTGRDAVVAHAERTVSANELWLTGAFVAADLVDARAAVLARGGGTVIDVRLAVFACNLKIKMLNVFANPHS